MASVGSFKFDPALNLCLANRQSVPDQNSGTNQEMADLASIHEPAPSRPSTVRAVANMEGHARQDGVSHVQYGAVSSYHKDNVNGNLPEPALERSPKRPRLDEHSQPQSQSPVQKQDFSVQPPNDLQIPLQSNNFAPQPIAEAQSPFSRLQSRDPHLPPAHQSFTPSERVGLPVGTMAHSWEFPPVRASCSRPPLGRENSETRRRTWTLSRTKRASSLNLNNHPNNSHPVGIAIWIVQKIDQARKAKTIEDITPRATSPPRSPGAGLEPWQQFDPAFLEDKRGLGSQEGTSPNTSALIGQQPIWGNTISVNHEDSSDRRQAQRNRKKKQREENWAKNKETDVVARAKAEARKDPNITANEHFEAEVRRRSTNDFDRLLTRQVHAFAADLVPLRPFHCGFAHKAVYRSVDDTVASEREPTVVEQEIDDKTRDNVVGQDFNQGNQGDALDARMVALRLIVNLLPVLSSSTSAPFQEAADALVRALHSPENIPGHDAFFVAIEALGTREDVQQGIDSVLNRLQTVRPDDRRTARHRTSGPAAPASSGISPSPASTTTRDLNWRTPITPSQNNFARPSQSHYQSIQASLPSNIYQPLAHQVPLPVGSMGGPFPNHYYQHPAPYHPFPSYFQPPPVVPYPQSTSVTIKDTVLFQPSPPLPVPAPGNTSVTAKETAHSESLPMLQPPAPDSGPNSQGTPLATKETDDHQPPPVLQPSSPSLGPQSTPVTAKNSVDPAIPPKLQPSPPTQIRSSSRERKPSHKLQAASVEPPSRITRQKRSPSPLPTPIPKFTKSTPKVPSKLGIYQIVADQAPTVTESTDKAWETTAVASIPEGAVSAGSTVNHEKSQDVPVYGKSSIQSYIASEALLVQQGIKPSAPHMPGPPWGMPSLRHEEGPQLPYSSVLVAAARFALEASDSDDDEDLPSFQTQRSPSNLQQNNHTSMRAAFPRQSAYPTTSHRFTSPESSDAVKSLSQTPSEASQNPTIQSSGSKELVAATPPPPKGFETTERSPVMDPTEPVATSLQASAVQSPAKDISRPPTSSSDRTNVYSQSSHGEPRLNSVMSAREARELSESWKREDIENRGRQIRDRSSASVSSHVGLQRGPVQSVSSHAEHNNGRGSKQHPSQSTGVTRKRHRSSSNEVSTKIQKAQKIGTIEESAGEAEVMLRLKRRFEDRGMVWVDSLNYDIASDMLDAHDKKRGRAEVNKNDDRPLSTGSYNERSDASTPSGAIAYAIPLANGQTNAKWQLQWPENSHSSWHGQALGHIPRLMPKYSYGPANGQSNGQPPRPVSSNSQPRSFGFTPINTDLARYDTAPPSPASPASSSYYSPNGVPSNPFASPVAAPPDGNRFTTLHPLSPSITELAPENPFHPRSPYPHPPTRPRTEPALNGGHPGGGLIINAPKRREQKGGAKGGKNNSSSTASGGVQNIFVARQNGMANSPVELNTPRRGGHLVNLW